MCDFNHIALRKNKSFYNKFRKECQGYLLDDLKMSIKKCIILLLAMSVGMTSVSTRVAMVYSLEDETKTSSADDKSEKSSDVADQPTSKIEKDTNVSTGQTVLDSEDEEEDETDSMSSKSEPELEKVDYYELGKKYFYLKKFAEAKEYFIRALADGKIKANFYLGMCYKYGYGVEKDEEKARGHFKILLSLLKDDLDAESDFMLGVCYTDGNGADRDTEEAFKRYKLAAEQGYVAAQYYLGLCYEEGNGVVQDSQEAFKWYELAAKQGHTEAQFALGECYRDGIGIDKNVDIAFKYFHMAADQGNVDAQFLLGVWYKVGQGTAQNVNKAFEYFRMAAEKGHSKAQYDLGCCYELGRGVEKNINEALKWYRLSSEKGYANAQFRLGKCYVYGKGVDQDEKQAFRWYKAAAERGHTEAQFNLGYYYYKGIGVAQDLSEAVKWYELAAKQGHAEAQFALGECYRDGIGIDKNVDIAFNYFHMAAERGHTEAQFNLGYYYYKGIGVAQDLSEAVKWYERAAEKGYTEAQFHLGCCYENGDGVAQNLAEAVKWYKRAAEHGCAKAQFNLGCYYYNGKGVDRDEKQAFLWYKAAADEGYVVAQFNLGCCYENGIGVDQDLAEAFRRYKEVVEQGYGRAQFKLGYFYDKGKGVDQDLAEAFRWYREAAEQGYAEAQFNLGVCYYSGKGVAQNLTEAFRWYREAAEQGYAEAQFNLGCCYYEGKGVDQDEKQAFHWYKAAADEGYVVAQFNLGCCYENGIGVDQDLAEAFRWYREAAGQGHAEAQFNLGVCYYSGKGVAQNLTEAFRWYREAAGQGHTEAQFNLGVCYYSGKGVAQNLTEAFRWYREAAEQGYAEAQFKLGCCYYEGKGVDQDEKQAFHWYKEAAEQGLADAEFELGMCYIFGEGAEKDLAEGAKWIHLCRIHRAENTGILKVSVGPVERTCDFFDHFGKVYVITTQDVNFVVRYFGEHFDRLIKFLEPNGIVIRRIDKSLLKEKIESKAIDVRKLNKLLTEAYDALHCAHFVLLNREFANELGLDRVLEILSEKDFCLSKCHSDVILTDKFLLPYVMSPWRTDGIPDDEIKDINILANIYGAGFDKDLMHAEGEKKEKSEHVYDYIFGSIGKFSDRFRALCASDANRTRELLAREMFWLRCMKERYDTGCLTEGEKRAYEKCRTLVETHFVSVRGECKNELADLMTIWAADIDECEDAMGMGVKVCDQETFDERFATAYRQYLSERVLSNDYVERLRLRSDLYGVLWGELYSLLGPEYRNYYRLLVARLLNVIPNLGVNFVSDRLLTGKDIVTMVADAIDLKDMCKISQQMYQGLADEKEAIVDDDVKDGAKPIKERLAMTIETEYEISFGEFCSIVDKTCGGDFKIRFEDFLSAFKENMDEDGIKAKKELQEWMVGEKIFTIAELIKKIMNLDLCFELANDLIPELIRFNMVLGSRNEKSAEYYAKVLYPIHLVKAGLIKIN